MSAPVVVAKGMNDLALRIKEAARWHSIPIVENPVLAQALFRATEVGEAIPAKLYTAVAEILAFLYRTQAHLRNSPARFHLRRLLEPFLPRVVVLSPTEIPAGISVQSLGVVR